MNFVSSTAPGRWAADVRGQGRALRTTAHPELGLLAISVWKDDSCAGTVHLAPSEVAAVVSRLTAGLAQLASSPVNGEVASAVQGGGRTLAGHPLRSAG